MARVAATEDVEGVRDEEAVEVKAANTENEQQEDVTMANGDENGVTNSEDAAEVEMRSASPLKAGTSPSGKHKYVATVQEVHEAFDSVNGLRYSQPCHLQGASLTVSIERLHH